MKHYLNIFINLDSGEHIHISDELACALRLFRVKSCCNLTDDAFRQTMMAVNGGNVSLFQVRRTLQSIVPIEPTWVDICINSCCAYTGKYKYDELCEYCYISRFQTGPSMGKRLPQRQMAFFSIKDRLKIQYQDPKGSERLKYRINYTHRQGFGSDGKIGDIFDGVRYQKLLSDGYFEDDRDIALTGSIDGYQIFRQKTEGCWIVLMINANICPEERVKKEHLLITAIIPGPKEPKCFNSFMYPIVKELKELECSLILIYIYIYIFLYIINVCFNIASSWNILL